MNNNIKNALNQVESLIIQHLELNHISSTILKSSKYSIEAGGKRFRPYLLLATLDALNTELKYGLKSAASLEMIHTYSLIHDDLPAMDNDNLRRGFPTNHIKFNEATAILAGDNLLTESFHLLSLDSNLSDTQKVSLIQLLAKYGGQCGMISGQMLDIEAENKNIEFSHLEKIHAHKTGALIKCAVEMGIIIANVNQNVKHQLLNYAYHLGILFQVKDDILDVTSTTETLGKTSGSDIVNNKVTYVSTFGLLGAKEKLEYHHNEAKNVLDALSEEYNIRELEVLLEKFTIRKK